MQTNPPLSFLLNARGSKGKLGPILSSLEEMAGQSPCSLDAGLTARSAETADEAPEDADEGV
jgi:hypothetical protein